MKYTPCCTLFLFSFLLFLLLLFYFFFHNTLNPTPCLFLAISCPLFRLLTHSVAFPAILFGFSWLPFCLLVYLSSPRLPFIFFLFIIIFIYFIFCNLHTICSSLFLRVQEEKGVTKKYSISTRVKHFLFFFSSQGPLGSLLSDEGL